MIMKKLAKISALLFAVVLIATGCKKLPEFTDGSSSGNVTPTTGGTLYYRLNGEPEIGTNYISISAKYGSENEITGMWLLVSEKADMPAGYTQYADIQMNYPEFSVTLTGLEPGTRYFWCINYLENGNSYVTDPEEFMTLEGGGGGSGDAPTGAINGLFSLGNSKHVYFSKGNLQFQASTNTWKFAENQYDFIGDDNANIGSSSYTGWIDLFGWGTGNNPTNSSISSHDYEDFTDWGNNAILNGGNTTNTWHSLTQDEWVMILFYRNTDSGLRFAKANVNGINGLILLPDNWSTSTYYLYNTNTANAAYSPNTIGLSNWSLLEEAGVVFLPAAGTRSGTTISNVESYGEYWTSSYFQADDAIDIYISDNSTETMVRGLSDGCSVRLVQDAE